MIQHGVLDIPAFQAVAREDTGHLVPVIGLWIARERPGGQRETERPQDGSVVGPPLREMEERGHAVRNDRFGRAAVGIREAWTLLYPLIRLHVLPERKHAGDRGESLMIFRPSCMIVLRIVFGKLAIVHQMLTREAGIVLIPLHMVQESSEKGARDRETKRGVSEEAIRLDRTNPALELFVVRCQSAFEPLSDGLQQNLPGQAIFNLRFWICDLRFRHSYVLSHWMYDS